MRVRIEFTLEVDEVEVAKLRKVDRLTNTEMRGLIKDWAISDTLEGLKELGLPSEIMMSNEGVE